MRNIEFCNGTSADARLDFPHPEPRRSRSRRTHGAYATPNPSLCRSGGRGCRRGDRFSADSLMRGERMRDLVALLQYLTRVRFAGDRALDGELRRFVIEVLDLLVVAGFPVDEDADA